MLKILECCCKSGQKKLGPELAPQILMNEIKKYTEDFKNIIITDDEFVDNNGYQQIYDQSIDEHDNKIRTKMLTKILTLGGDHSIGLSTVMSSLYKYRENLKVIWVDAHADINTFETSFSKNKHGMPLSPTLQLMEPWIKVRENQYYMKPHQLVYIGLRSVDEPEKEIIKNLGIEAYYASDVRNIGIENIMKNIIEDNKTKYHLSFDIDGIDPKYTPSTGTAEGEGITLDDGVYIVDSLVKTNNLKAFDLVEFNPLIGTEEDKKLTLESCVKLLEKYIV
jgi:arginase